MSGGQTHLVKHPEIVDPDEDSISVCALLHVTDVEMQQKV
jgi:hypothetical protein